MAEQLWVDQVRTLLARARQQHGVAFHDLGALKISIDEALRAAEEARRAATRAFAHQVPYPIRRRNLLAQIGLKSKHYGLADEAQAFVYAAGFLVIQQLEIEQLEALHGWLARCVDDMEAGCDSRFSPPAR